MVSTLKKIFQNEELKNRILFTVLMLFVCRIGAYIPVPGVNGDEVVKIFRYATGGGQNLFQLLDVFTGGAFAHMTVVALGVMPYISASIIMQLLMAIIPSLQREIRENGDQGRRKMGKWTRFLTLALAIFQSSIYARQAISMNFQSPGVIHSELLHSQIFGFPWLFFLLVVFTMTTGTLFLMWVGEQITDKGIGNGMSLIISLGIVSSLPFTVGNIIKSLNLDSQEPGQMTLSSLLVLSAVFVSIIIGTILIIQGVRKIPLQYARRAIDEKNSDRSAHIPLKINYAGVIPVIFASAILMFPATIAQFVGKSGMLATIASWLSPGNPVYGALYVLLIVFFTFFWTATQFRPDQIASDMKKGGAFIPGVRQGRATEEYLEKCMNRITLIGAVSLALIAILPTIIGRLLSVDQTVSHFFGGTSLLILVGVVLDTMKQIESHLLMERYEGFMSRKKTSGRF